MAFGATEIIMFGIQAGVRLYGQARQAYVEKTRERELVMPLPGLDHSPTVTRAFAYFKDNIGAAGRAARDGQGRRSGFQEQPSC